MEISKGCLSLVKKWEGFYANAYLCPANVWTIGFGTTVWPNGKRVKKVDTITREEAERLLEKQVNEHASTIMQYVKVPLNQNQYDALASFQYNLGRHILKGSYLLKYLNAKQWDKAANSMMQYNKARVNGVLTPLRGLTNRRTEEVALFKKPYTTANKGDEELEFSNSNLKKTYETRHISKATAELLKTAAEQRLNIKVPLDNNSLKNGDLNTIAIELAVHLLKPAK